MKLGSCDRSILAIFLYAILFATLFGVVVILALLYWIFSSNTEVLVFDGLYGQAEEVAANLIVDQNGVVSVEMHEPMQWAYDSFFANLKYRILDDQGRLLLSSDGEAAPLLTDQQVDLDNLPYFSSQEIASGILYVGVFSFEKSGQRFIIQTARSDRFSELAEEAIKPAVFETAAVLAIGLLVIFVVALLVAVRAAVRRISRVSADAERINLDSLDTRIDMALVPSELSPLVSVFNEVLDRLSNSFRAQERFIANATHELKTPLAILRAQIELHTEGKLQERLLFDTDEMSRNVRQMMHLFQAQDPRRYHFERLDLCAIANAVKDSLDRLPSMAGKTLLLIGQVEARQIGDRAAVFTALRNLVENAIKATQKSGKIRINVLPNGFSVEDEGKGFNDAHRQRMFERFWREDTTGSGGSGLGLSIVQEVALAHHGNISAVNKPAGGAIFTFILGVPDPGSDMSSTAI